VSAVVDAAERAAAIRPTGSFCVTAPAGSGKTELLIQRYLGLLSRVQRPEQVLAITFTRKAAAEMRARVLDALRGARQGDPCDSPHEQVTRNLALAALDSDAQRGWQLARDVARLNIKTIDGFCMGLTRQMPVLSQFGGQASPQDDTDALYREAVRELYAELDRGGAIADDLRAVLSDFDNNWEGLEELLVAMLARREQWRAFIEFEEGPDAAGHYLAAAVDGLVGETLDPVRAALEPHGDDLLPLLQYACDNLGQPTPAHFPGAQPEYLDTWRALCNMLLTGGGQWRSRLDKTMGFPPGKGVADERKAELKAVIARLEAVEGLREALCGVLLLPGTGQGSQDWQRVEHLSRLLPVLSTKLLLVFRRRGVVDHGQVALGALQALGDDDAPTELAQRLDYSIEHILVDEFQDTSNSQYELLQRLTRGWGEYNEENPQAPRTFMIVGDAMQSIYGFRGANVGLFLKAQEEGFNGVLPKTVELKCNFRSRGGIVDWVNATFRQAFPREDDINHARVSYRAAVAIAPAERSPAVEQYAFHGEGAGEGEIDFVCDLVRDCLAESRETIAVLGRTRGHLQPIAAALKLRGIAFSAQELESLASSTVVADLLSLCDALACDADRLAWLAVLRAPWCGLTLADLGVIGEWARDHLPIRRVLAEPAALEALSADGRQRVERVFPVLEAARTRRDRLALRVWVEQTWTDLGGPGCTDGETQLSDAESFLQLLELAETERVGLDGTWLRRQLETRYTSGGDPQGRVQLMTLHKAKGLEFDRVVIPRLNGIPRSDGRDLLLWDERRDSAGNRRFLLAAREQQREKDATLYNYLRSVRREKSLLERTRLLYVGCTRAVRRLYLTASPAWDDAGACFKAPGETSLLHPVWSGFDNDARRIEVAAGAGFAGNATTGVPLRRLARAVGGVQPPGAADTVEGAGKNRPDRPDNPVERSVGTVVHAALEDLSLRAQLPQRPQAEDIDRWRAALRALGLSGAQLENALEAVCESIRTTLDSGGSGRWILDAGHGDPRSEWALSVVREGVPRDIAIDRCFIDRETGVRWIVDYKTSRPGPDERLEDFAAREAGKYRGQLEGYRDAVRCMGSETVRCALYFTAPGLLHVLDDLDLPTGES